MRVSLKWLEEYVRVDVPVAKLVELLDLSGTKVENILEPGKGLEGVIVAEVLDISEHPNADNLILVGVRIEGAEERVVCGAKNFAVGDKVPYAQVGARLPELEITERKIRGEVSRGMLCSAAELGVSKDHSGILVLAPDAPVGSDVIALLGLDDVILELEITPNRPDCMGMIGIAREVAALLGNELQVPALPEASSAGLTSTPPPIGGPVTVMLQDAIGCPRYVAHLIEGVQVGPSVGWISTRLLAAGVRPISNVVDATNYVLLETGHPLHAFDATKVHDHSIVVRRARAKERLQTLDGVDRVLIKDDLVIADPKKALALAGVMGGADSEVGEGTTEVILEAAYFDPVTIARTSRRLGLRSEASARFERGTDPEALPFAAARCAHVIASTAGAPPSSQVVDEYPTSIARERVTLRPERTSKLLGFELEAPTQAKLLRSIQLVVDERDGLLDVEVPGFRPDIRREVDLIEEVARLAGYERLPSTIPHGDAGELEAAQKADRLLRRAFASLGANEAWTTSLGNAQDLDLLELAADHPARRMVGIANPMSDLEDKMRTTLLPGLLRAAARNVARRVDNVALFEIARVFEASSELLPDQPTNLGGVFVGERSSTTWKHPAVAWDFFEVKGIVLAAVASLGVTMELAPVEGMPFHPTRAAAVSIGSSRVGAIGELHPRACERFDVPEGTVVFEIAAAPVVAAMPARPTVPELPRFPAAFIDLAVVVADDVAAAAVEDAIRSAGAPELESVQLFDLYRGEQVEVGKKSLAYALRMRVPDRTLTDDDAVAVRERMVGALRDRFQAELRG